MNTAISEGYICDCGKKYQRIIFPNRPVGSVSCDCQGKLTHLWTSKVEYFGEGQHMCASMVYEHPMPRKSNMQSGRKTSERRSNEMGQSYYHHEARGLG